MNRIILIGNGFDLAHGLKTSSKNFINDYWKRKSQEIKKCSSGKFEDSDIFMERRDRRNYQDDWPDTIESYQDFIDYLKTSNHYDIYRNLKFYNTYLQTISDNCGLDKMDNWVDLEEEYYRKLIQILKSEKKDKDIDTLNDGFQLIKQKLEVYLTDIINTSEVKAKEKITNIIYSVFDSKDFSQQGKKILKQEAKSILLPHHLLFLNFNYTDLEKLYKDRCTIERSTNFNIERETIHIHGEINNPNNPIIFGYGDELSAHFAEIENQDNFGFLENMKSIKYLETDNYKRLLDFIDSDNYQIIILGHSCGRSDRTLLNMLFEHKNCVSVKVFYYSQKKIRKEENRVEEKNNFSFLMKSISRQFKNKNTLRDKVVNKLYSCPFSTETKRFG